ncbi:hypothetical protein EDC05_006409 [Coemansia umbellata]|uniref:GH18 domain-containing protein n=1 Tax=Coemansia umbellata TaxID=1424467 RepID=A0ABQ8PCU7_9FUNG|nr:hypothetical protein EDC05_006409 [Coemansia umbellata]
MQTPKANIVTLSAAAIFAVAYLATDVEAAEPVVLGYYPSWKRTKMQDVDFSKYTHVNIAFSIPRSDGTFSFEDEWALPQILKQVRAGGTKALMSVGGWTGSNFFSPILKSNDAREKLLTSMTRYVKDNGLDGIDIDWEYPGRLGNTCNAYDPQNDAPNFLNFLKDLRSRFDSTFGDKNKLITLAVRVQPFDSTGGPMPDVSEFARYVDYANIMAYDIGGPWNSETGPNAPFNFESGKGTALSFVSAIDAWTGAQWPANKLVAGLGFYGRSSLVQQDMTRDTANQYQPQSHEVPLGDSDDAPWYDACAGTTSVSGTWQWRNLRTQGILTNSNSAAAPWIRQWDSVTQTPWLFNPSTKTYLSYDDPDSIKIKSDYAASKGLAGVMIWSANMDYNGELIDAAKSFGGNKTASGPKSSTSPSSSLSSPTSSLSSSSSSSSLSLSSTSSSSISSSSTSSSIPSSSSSISSSSSSTSSSSSSTSSLSSSSTSSSSSHSSNLSTASSASSSSSSPTLTSSSSSASFPSPTTSQQPVDDSPKPGSPCIEIGKNQCVDPNGRNSAYLVCVGGKWVPRSCAPATICTTFGSSILCSWPRLKNLVQDVDTLFHHA